MKKGNTDSVSHWVYRGTLLPLAVPAGCGQVCTAAGAPASPRHHSLAALAKATVHHRRPGSILGKEARQ